MLLKDDKAVSPVIAEVLMTLVCVILAAVAFIFAYNTIWGATEVSPVVLLIEGAEVGSSNITIVHMSGGKLEDAFAPNSSAPDYFLDDTILGNIEVRINGAVYEGWASLNGGAISKGDFECADELKLGLDRQLSKGDSISVIFVPNGQMLAREVVEI